MPWFVIQALSSSSVVIIPLYVFAMSKMEIWDKNKYQQFFDTFSPESFSTLAAEVMAKKDQP